MYSSLSSCKIQKKSKRKEHSSDYFLDNRKRCKSAYQQAAENVSEAKRSFKISGSKAESIDRVFTHARGTLNAWDAVGDEECPNSCEDDTNSSDSDDSLSDSTRYVEESFEVMFVKEEELQQVN